MKNTTTMVLAAYFYALFISALTFIFFITEMHLGIVLSFALLAMGIAAILLSE